MLKGKRLVALFIAVLLVLTVFAGCGNKVSTGETPAATVQSSAGTAAPASTVAEVPKPEKIVVINNQHIGTEEPDKTKAFEAAFEKISGVPVEIINTSEAETMVATKLAAGEQVDVFIGSLTKSLNKFYQQGALVPIEQSWIDASTNVKNIPADYWTVVRKSGKILSVPYRSMQKLALFIRQDWLDKLGLKVPVTIDDWYNVSRAFAYDDPDGNKKQDTYGYAGQNEWDTGSYFFQPIQNAIVKYTAEIAYDKQENKLKFVPFEEDYKTYLSFLQKSFKEKIIEPNIFTNKEENMRNLFFSGKTGIINDYVDLVDDNIAKTTAVNPNAKITLFSPPTGPQGSGFFAFLSDLSIGILKSTKNPEATFKYFIDSLHSLEGQQLLVYGPEGVNWKKGADGKAVAIVDKYSNGLMPFLVINQDKFQPILPMSDPTKLSLDLFSKSLKYANYNIAPLNPKFDEMYSQFLEYYAKIITGKLEVNAGIEEWKVKFNEKGFNQYFDDANKDTSWAN